MACLTYSRSYNQIRRDGDEKLGNTQNDSPNAARYCLTCRILTEEYCLRCREAFCSIDCSFKGYRLHKGDCITSSPHSAMDTAYINQLNSKPYYNDCRGSISNVATSLTNLSIGSDEDCSKVPSKCYERTSPVGSENESEVSESLPKKSNEQVGDCPKPTEVRRRSTLMRISKRVSKPTAPVVPMPEYLTRDKRTQFEKGKPIEIQIMNAEKDRPATFVFKDDVDTLERLMTDLNNFTPDRAVQKLREGCRCVMWYKQEWYRSTIVRVEPLTVRLVDFGLYMDVHFASLFEIPQQFVHVLPFSSSVRVVGISHDELISLQKTCEPLEVIPMFQGLTGMWTVKARIKDEQKVNPKAEIIGRSSRQ